jgi:hypothetical protein
VNAIIGTVRDGIASKSVEGTIIIKGDAIKTVVVAGIVTQRVGATIIKVNTQFIFVAGITAQSVIRGTTGKANTTIKVAVAGIVT